MSIDLAILVVSATMSMLLGLVIFLRNARAKTNVTFVVFTLSISLWSAFNYIADNGPASTTLLFTRLTFLAGLFIAVSAVWLSSNFPRENLFKRSKHNLFVSYCFVVTALVVFTPYFVPTATKTAGAAQVGIGALYPVFLAFIVLAVGTFIYNLLVQHKKAESLVERAQTRLVLAGVILYAVFATTSNLLLPVLIDDWTSSRYGPLSALFTVLLIGYAIVRHRLLDIRLIVVRSLAYVQVLAVTAALYGFIVFGLANIAFDLNLSVVMQAAFSFATGFAALSFPYVKRAVDKVTNTLLYRDAYDSQDFFGELNKALVSTIELNKLLKSVLDVIEKYLKPESTFVIIKYENEARPHVVSLFDNVVKDTDEMKRIRQLLSDRHQAIIVSDHLGPEDHDLKEVMTRNDIAILVRMGLRSNDSVSRMGLLAIGPKKSGNPYNTQDIRAVEAMADVLVVATQNALRFEQIRRFSATLEEKVEDSTKRLRRTNARLKAMDETKDDFISMASHQLRTPLTSIKGYVSMVLDGDMGEINPAQRQALNQALISSQRMVFLIADLLNLSRLKTGKFVIEPTPTKLSDIIESEVNQLQETAKARELELIYRKPAHFPTLMLDETKIRQVAMNFMDNAIYYTHSGGHIAVELKETDKAIEFTVSDDGIGVPKHEQPHLFNKFYRAGNARKARPDGTGLGLFMAKKVIVAQGGSIIFHSKEGEGSTFGFSFAKAKLIAPPNANPVFHESSALAVAEKSLNS